MIFYTTHTHYTVIVIRLYTVQINSTRPHIYSYLICEPFHLYFVSGKSVSLDEIVRLNETPTQKPKKTSAKSTMEVETSSTPKKTVTMTLLVMKT